MIKVKALLSLRCRIALRGEKGAADKYKYVFFVGLAIIILIRAQAVDQR